ncbi:hypothetical protein ABTK20_22870, partial [Acinetobacter baumannii]
EEGGAFEETAEGGADVDDPADVGGDANAPEALDGGDCGGLIAAEAEGDAVEMVRDCPPKSVEVRREWRPTDLPFWRDS